MARDFSLYQALQRVELDARERALYHTGLLSEKPLRGWSQEKHNAYHEREIALASDVQHYCFIRLMQIDPD